ncbi:MAG TPA: hypothetical protein VHR84_04980 [Terriglobales bacterium]|jgi:hypothetical protein|nr:hypothetical protein [Terriglobales bacterium]
MARTYESVLKYLEEHKPRIAEVPSARLRTLISQLATKRPSDALSLGRFHDLLLFLRAFPSDPTILRLSDRLLASFSKRIRKLTKAGVDLSAIQDGEEFAGIAGTTLTTILDYEEAAWLTNCFPGHLSIDWDSYEEEHSLAPLLTRFIPLFEEDGSVEPDVPYSTWLRNAANGRGLEWLLDQLRGSELPNSIRSALFGALHVPIRWSLGDSLATRTHARRQVKGVFFHRDPLIQRRDVSLASELSKEPFQEKRLSFKKGEEIITMCREATSVRYRELYGTTRGDPHDVVQFDVGRGVQIFMWGLPPTKRLPLRAYQAGFTLKNGIPINYIEAISLFEWVEVGFNTFYAYRDGETAWVYAQVLRILRQRLGALCISVYPYQIGQNNEEALASGAFWFYRKLGFRCMRSDLEQLARREEQKIAADRTHRTSLPTLRKLAEGHVAYELPGAARGAWDHFRMRNIGLALAKKMGTEYGGDPQKMLKFARKKLSQFLRFSPDRLTPEERLAWDNFSFAFSLHRSPQTWQPVEKSAMARIIRAKARIPDADYVRLLRAHTKLRAVLLEVGSKI